MRIAKRGVSHRAVAISELTREIIEVNVHGELRLPIYTSKVLCTSAERP